MEPNKKQIDILLLRRELQNAALWVGDYTQEELQKLLFRAIELIDELRINKTTCNQIMGFNQDLLSKEVNILLKQSLEMIKSDILGKISSLEYYVEDCFDKIEEK